MQNGRLSTAATIMAVLLGASSAADAQLIYDFVDDSELSTVLATIEFSELPGDHNDVVGLTFTTAGNELFGLGTSYLGTFDRMGQDTIGFMDDTQGGLLGANCDFGNSADMHDDDPPSRSRPGVQDTLRLTLYARSIINFPSDEISLEYVDLSGVSQTLSQRGLWRAVPEPHSASLACFAVIAIGAIRRHSFGNVSYRRPAHLGRDATGTAVEQVSSKLNNQDVDEEERNEVQKQFNDLYAKRAEFMKEERTGSFGSIGRSDAGNE